MMAVIGSHCSGKTADGTQEIRPEKLEVTNTRASEDVMDPVSTEAPVFVPV